VPRVAAPPPPPLPPAAAPSCPAYHREASLPPSVQRCLIMSYHEPWQVKRARLRLAACAGNERRGCSSPGRVRWCALAHWAHAASVLSSFPIGTCLVQKRRAVASTTPVPARPDAPQQASRTARPSKARYRSPDQLARVDEDSAAPSIFQISGIDMVQRRRSESHPRLCNIFL
jgi:hypothetical protein